MSSNHTAQPDTEVTLSSATTKNKSIKQFFTPQLCVYISHFLSSWGDRMWMFAGGLFLIEITPKSLRLVAVYQSALSLTVIFLGAAVGRWVDKTSRLTAAQVSLFVQNVMVCLCTLLLCLVLSYKSTFLTSLNGWSEILIEIVVILTACIAQIGTLGSKIAIEKDWIVVISGNNKNELSKMNSVLRTVDLSTEMMAPILVGFIMSFSGMIAGGIAVACWNVASFIVEYSLLHYLFRTIPDLQKPKLEAPSIAQSVEKHRNLLTNLTETRNTWGRYFSHKVRDAGLSLATLYMTVLALDNYSRAYVYEGGVSKLVLGLLTACASFSGILGSISYPQLRKNFGVHKTGIIGFTWETLCLIFCVAGMFAPGTLFGPFAEPLHELPSYNTDNNQTSFLNDSIVFTSGNATVSEIRIPPVSHASVGLLLAGIILSRCGLWIADLTITQILQEEVDEEERGRINGVQYSLNQIFSLFRSILIIILPSVETFGYLVIVSFFFVFSGGMLFIVYTIKNKPVTKPEDTEAKPPEISTEKDHIDKPIQNTYGNPEFEDVPL